jgi:hypothetical protein
MEFSFSQKFESLWQNLMACSPLLTRVSSYDLDLWKGLDIIILLRSPTFISRVASSALHFVFLERDGASPIMYFWIAPQLDHAPLSVQFGFSLAMRLSERRFGYLKGIVFK